MVITYHNGECFKITSGDHTIAVNPPGKGSGFKTVKFGADVALVSLRHPDFNGVDAVTYGSKQPFVIDGPGEYEIGDLTVRGYGVETNYDGKERFVTMYLMRKEGISLLFLGPVGSDALPSSVQGALGGIDILFVPVGGGDVLDVPAASKLAAKLGARIIIPMHYDATTLAAFLKEMGSTNGAPEEKLSIKKNALAAIEGNVVVLAGS